MLWPRPGYSSGAEDKLDGRSLGCRGGPPHNRHMIRMSLCKVKGLDTTSGICCAIYCT